jgi:hypothetical protein
MLQALSGVLGKTGVQDVNKDGADQAGSKEGAEAKNKEGGKSGSEGSSTPEDFGPQGQQKPDDDKYKFVDLANGTQKTGGGAQT